MIADRMLFDKLIHSPFSDYFIVKKSSKQPTWNRDFLDQHDQYDRLLCADYDIGPPQVFGPDSTVSKAHDELDYGRRGTMGCL
jgi:hypothetical protein